MLYLKYGNQEVGDPVDVVRERVERGKAAAEGRVGEPVYHSLLERPPWSSCPPPPASCSCWRALPVDTMTL